MISKIFHYIWVSSKLPPYFENNINKWKQIYPDYQFKFWGNDNLNDDIFKGCFNLIHNTSIHVACKSDIMRYYILQKYGGWYIDTDTYPIKRMPDSFNKEYEFIAGLYAHQIGIIGNSIFGSEKDSFFINKIITEIPRHLKILNLDTRFLTKDACFATGPEYISKIYYQNRLKLNNKINILPSPYFYPVQCCGKFKIEKETYSVHENAGSWQNSWVCIPSGDKIIL